MDLKELLRLLWPVVSQIGDSLISAAPAWMQLAWPYLKRLVEAWVNNNELAGIEAAEGLQAALSGADLPAMKLKLKGAAPAKKA